MKIEICEQMTQSWLSHIKCCQVVQTNWSISPLWLNYLKATSQFKDSESFISQVQVALSGHSFPGNFDSEAFLSTLAEDIVSDLYEGMSYDEHEEYEADNVIDETFCERFMSLVNFAQKNKTDTGKWLNDIKILSKSNNKDPFYTFIKQCETDVVGIKVKDNIVEKVYFVDTAFHSDGLNYSGKSNTETRITKKLIKFIAVSDIVFGTKVPVHIIFAAPYCRKTRFDRIKYILDYIIRPCSDKRPSLAGAPNNVTIDLYCNNDFVQKIYNPLKSHLDELNNDNELFIRAMNLAKTCEFLPVAKVSKRKKHKAGGTVRRSTATRHICTESEIYEMAACYLKQGTILKAIETKILGKSSNGSVARRHLNNLGIDTSRNSKHKGLLASLSIDDAIAKTSGVFKTTLEEIQKRKLL